MQYLFGANPFKKSHLNFFLYTYTSKSIDVYQLFLTSFNVLIKNLNSFILALYMVQFGLLLTDFKDPILTFFDYHNYSVNFSQAKLNQFQVLELSRLELLRPILIETLKDLTPYIWIFDQQSNVELKY